jgi:glycosyltransferase involved in cell wall biosynthesis
MRVSFLSPVYNEAMHISEMIESLQKQTHRDWELVLVDDGSDDETQNIIRDFSTRDERVRLVHCGKRIGKVRAFNKAYEESTGDVIAISGGDDVHPTNAVALRALALVDLPKTELAVVFFKLCMFSSDPRYDGLTLPRGRRGSRSGPSITMSRPLAERLFPIPPTLISEDIWLGEAAEGIAAVVIEDAHIVVRYRVHAGNSNPRHKSFEQMNQAMHDRGRAWQSLLSGDRLALTSQKQGRLQRLCQAEIYRYQGETLRLLALRRLPLIDRLGMASMSSPLLWRLRTRYYRALSGWRGR